MSKVHCISGITWKNSDSASFKVYASIGAVLSLGLVTATVRNYEILQLTVPYTWYVFFTAFWLCSRPLRSLSGSRKGVCLPRWVFTG
jgi:hypothetical protein